MPHSQLIHCACIFLTLCVTAGSVEGSNLLLIQVGATAKASARASSASQEALNVPADSDLAQVAKELRGLLHAEGEATQLHSAVLQPEGTPDVLPTETWQTGDSSDDDLRAGHHRGSGMWKHEQVKKAEFIFLSEHSMLPVDIRPSGMHMWRTVGRYDWLFAPEHQQRFRLVAFLRNYVMSLMAPTALLGESKAEGDAKPGDWRNHAWYWTIFFLCCLLGLACLTWFVCEGFKVTLPPAMDPLHKVMRSGRSMWWAARGDEDMLINARGHPAWSYICVAMAAVLCNLVFVVTVMGVNMVNAQVELNPSVVQLENEKIVTVTRFPITEPTKGGYEAAIGVAFSISVATCLVFAWRWRKKVAVTSALLARFALRGATLSLVVAIVLEIVGEELLRDTGHYAGDGFKLGNAMMMFVVGISEETAKLVAVVLGTYCSAHALGRETANSCCKSWNLLIESRRAMVLCGFAVGFGFMINENAEYMMAMACNPPMSYADGDGQEIEKVDQSSLAYIAVFTILVRVVFNIHPWWCGISAARVSSLVYPEARERAMPGVGEFLWAIAPSAIAHASYDFIVSGGAPALVALLAPPGFWMLARWVFMDEFGKSEEPKNAERSRVGDAEGVTTESSNGKK